MIEILIFFGAVDVALTVIESVFHLSWLPLGGSHAAQLGSCLGTALVVITLLSIFKPPPPGASK
jgi:hypothetical protein